MSMYRFNNLNEREVMSCIRAVHLKMSAECVESDFAHCISLINKLHNIWITCNQDGVPRWKPAQNGAQCAVCGGAPGRDDDGEVIYSKYCPSCGTRLLESDITITLDSDEYHVLRNSLVRSGDRMMYEKLRVTEERLSDTDVDHDIWRLEFMEVN